MIKKKVQRCPETTHRILLGFSLACSHQYNVPAHTPCTTPAPLQHATRPQGDTLAIPY